MEQFEITTRNTRDFEIIDIGRVTFLKWSSNKAAITLAYGTAYQMEPHGFWGVRYALLKDGAVHYQVKMSFWGKITITPVKEAHHFYTLKHKGWKGGFVLQNYKEEEVAKIISNYSWKSFTPAYTLTVQPGFMETGQGKLLILLLGYHYSAMQRGAAAIGVVS